MKQLLEEKRQEVEALKQELDNLLTCESPEQIAEAMIQRDEKKQDLQKIYNAAKDKEADLQAIMREIRGVKGELTHQNKKLEAHKWDKIAERRSTTHSSL